MAPLMHHSQHAEPGASPGWRHPVSSSLRDPHKSNSPPEPLRLCLRYLWGRPPRPSASARPADEPGAGGERRLNTWTWSYILESGRAIYSHFLMFPSQVCATFWSLSWSRPSCTHSGGKTHGEVRNMWPGGFKGSNLSKAWKAGTTAKLTNSMNGGFWEVCLNPTAKSN